MVVVVGARMPVPVRLTVCWVPGTLPLLSWKLNVPVIGPVVVGANVTYSSQLAPGARGEAGRQFGVVFWKWNPGSSPSTVMYNGLLPLFVSVSFCGALVVPTG